MAAVAASLARQHIPPILDHDPPDREELPYRARPVSLGHIELQPQERHIGRDPESDILPLRESRRLVAEP